MVRRAGIVPFVCVLIIGACNAQAPVSSTPSPTASGSSGSPAATPVLTATPAGPPATADDWPFFRGNAARTGEGGSGPVGHPVLRWRYQAGGSINGAVVIVGDFVYASSDDDVLHAIDVDTGEEAWHFSPVNPPVSAPAVADGVVYAFDGAGTLFGLDAATGRIRWHSAVPLDHPSSVTIDNGTLYAGTGGGAIVALDTTNGAERWHYTIPSGGGVHNPAYADGLVYAGSDSGGLVAVDAGTGKLVWHFDTGSDITGSAVVAGGIAYIGGTGDSVNGKMSALDAKTGQLLWQLDRPFTAPAVANGVAFEGDQIGGLEATDTATGKELWTVPTERAGPSVADGIVYVGLNAAHGVDAFDAATGAELWHFDVDGGNSCCVAVAHRAVFVATESGSVYRIDGDGSTISPGSTPTTMPSPSGIAPSPSAVSATGSPLAGPSPVEFLWSATGGGNGMEFPGSMALDPEGRLWVADTGNSRFAIFDPDGKFVEYWEHRGTGEGEFLLERGNGDGLGAIAFAPDGSFYVLDVGNHRVEHFDQQRGFIKSWGSFGTGAGQYEDPIGLAVDSNGVVYVLDDIRNVVERYDADGTVLGRILPYLSAPAGYESAAPFVVDADGNIYTGIWRIDNEVLKLDPSGTVIGTFGSRGSGPGQFPGQPGAGAVDGAGRLFVAIGVADQSSPMASVWIFASDGSFQTGFTVPGLGDTKDGFVTALLLDGMGNGYVAESTSNLVEKFRLLPPFSP